MMMYGDVNECRVGVVVRGGIESCIVVLWWWEWDGGVIGMC